MQHCDPRSVPPHDWASKAPDLLVQQFFARLGKQSTCIIHTSICMFGRLPIIPSICYLVGPVLFCFYQFHSIRSCFRLRSFYINSWVWYSRSLINIGCCEVNILLVFNCIIVARDYKLNNIISKLMYYDVKLNYQWNINLYGVYISIVLVMLNKIINCVSKFLLSWTHVIWNYSRYSHILILLQIIV